MRIWLCCAICALTLLGMATVATAQDFTDVPEHHWAFEAIDYLAEAGLVEGYPDGTFKGDRPFTRYEMAMVIARIFTKIQDWQAMTGDGTLPPGDGGESLDTAEIFSRLDRLSDEFREELADLGARVTAIEDEQAIMRDEMDDIRGLIKDSGLTGTVRWRSGAWVSTGAEELDTDIGFEQRIELDYEFQPEENLQFNFKVASTEMDGPVGTGFIPGANNENATTNPGNGVLSIDNPGSSFVIDEAYATWYWEDAPGIVGDRPAITLGKQHFSEGEFGLAGDNGYKSNFGLRADVNFGNEVSGHVGAYRTDAVNATPFATNNPPAFQSTGVTSAGDDYLLAGLEFHSGEGTIPGHLHKLVLRADFAPNGYGAESYVSVSGNAEIPWFSDDFLNGIRGEWVMLTQNVGGLDPDADLGLDSNSFVLSLDLFNDGDSRVTVAGAQIAQIEGLPVYANVDNDPFSEWDFTVNELGDAFNLSREGPNFFPADFVGFGFQAEHGFNGNLHGLLTYYSGSRINAAADDRPGMLRVGLRYPFSNNSQLGLDYIMAGQRTGIEDPLSLVRGEFKINF
jgi:hypothetical protein